MQMVTVSVDYGDLLGITLVRNARFFERVIVVTAPHDVETQEIAKAVPNVVLHQTDAFYRRGAVFNKGAALEEGLRLTGRRGWIAVMDADTLLPDWPVLDQFRIGSLYTPQRYILRDPRRWHPDLDWRTLELFDEREWAGYCQIFHADDPRLRQRETWYATNWLHAGGCDSDFQQIWPSSHKHRPKFKVLHLGEDGVNWAGRATVRLDGTVPPEARSRRERVHQFRAGRVSGPNRFKKEQLD